MLLVTCLLAVNLIAVFLVGFLTLVTFLLVVALPAKVPFAVVLAVTEPATEAEIWRVVGTNTILIYWFPLTPPDQPSTERVIL